MTLPCQRDRFDIPPDIAWFNTAYMSAQLKVATEAGLEGLARKATPWTISPADFFGEPDAARSAFARLIGARADDVAIIPAVSYGLGLAARTLPLARGGKILVLEGEFPSNFYPWAVRAAEVGAVMETVPSPPDGDWTRAVLERLDPKVAIAALPNCHWADGGVLDLVRIGAACRDAGAALALDLTQSAGAFPISVQAVDPDFLVAASYKWLLGPYSLGFAYVSPRWQQARPLEEGWASRAGAEDFAGLVRYTDLYQPGARRFDVGERANFALLPVAIAALEQLLTWTPAAIAETLEMINADLAERLRPLGLRARDAAVRSPHLLGLELPERAPADLVSRLAAERLYVSQRGRMLRISPHLHVTFEDMDRLVDGLARQLA